MLLLKITPPVSPSAPKHGQLGAQAHGESPVPAAHLKKVVQDAGPSFAQHSTALIFNRKFGKGVTPFCLIISVTNNQIIYIFPGHKGGKIIRNK